MAWVERASGGARDEREMLASVALCDVGGSGVSVGGSDCWSQSRLRVGAFTLPGATVPGATVGSVWSNGKLCMPEITGATGAADDSERAERDTTPGSTGGVVGERMLLADSPISLRKESTAVGVVTGLL